MRRRHAAVAGLIAGGVALAVGELVAGLGRSQRSPVIAVGDLVIDAVPRPVKDFAIDVFGQNDKRALLVGIYAVIAVIAALVGIRAARRFADGAVGIAAFGVVGVVAATQEVDVGFAEVAASALGAVAGIVALRVLVRAAPVEEERVDAGRRSLLVLGASLAGVAVATGAFGRFLQSRVSAASSRLAVVLPRASRPLPPVPAGAELGIDGLAPFVTPNDRFYRIDVNLLVPQVPTDGWTLTIKGRVEREVVLTYAELLAEPMVEADITLACVSNEIGGGLVGNARWLGTPLLPLLERAGVDASADQVVGRAVDGFTVGFPVDALRDDRPALVAVGMNGEPLPIRHGFPARLVVAGLYGYVSATKWLEEIELARFDELDPYWVRRAWAVEAPIKTMSRIDTPRGSVDAGPVPVAGVAWAGTRGVAAVEVRIDDGRWVEADLSEEISANTWRQWLYRWDATPGRHNVTVRATDGDGVVQTEERAQPFPDGATGWHTVRVDVR